MTPDIDLDALTALVEKASPAPWEVTKLHTTDTKFVIVGGPEAYAVGTCWTQADGELIAAARNNLPALLSALTATRAELEQARKTIAWGAEQIPAAQAEATEEVRKRELAERERDAARAEADHLRKVLDAANATTEAAQRIVTAALADGTATIAPAAAPPQPFTAADRDRWLEAKRMVAEDAAAPKPDEPCRTCRGSGTTWTRPTASRDDDDLAQVPCAACGGTKAAGAGDGEQDTATTHAYAFSWDGDTLWLECDPCKERNGEWIVCSAEPGDTWDELVEAVADHKAAFHAAPASVQGAADGEAQAAGEACACGPKEYCHLDNCQGVDGPLIPCPTVGCQFGCESLAEMDDHVRSGQC